jgi:hypothetical protein
MAVLALFVVVIGTLPTAAYGKTHHMTRAEVRVELKAAARFYHLSAAKTRWIVAKGIHIVFVGHTGYGESNGNTNTGHRNGCYGLFQFGAGWKHNITLAGVHYRDFRSSGRGSIYRFVKVYKVGGRAKILQHWRATY